MELVKSQFTTYTQYTIHLGSLGRKAGICNLMGLAGQRGDTFYPDSAHFIDDTPQLCNHLEDSAWATTKK